MDSSDLRHCSDLTPLSVFVLSSLRLSSLLGFSPFALSHSVDFHRFLETCRRSRSPPLCFSMIETASLWVLTPAMPLYMILSSYQMILTSLYSRLSHGTNPRGWLLNREPDGCAKLTNGHSFLKFEIFSVSVCLSVSSNLMRHISCEYCPNYLATGQDTLFLGIYSP